MLLQMHAGIGAVHAAVGLVGGVRQHGRQQPAQHLGHQAHHVLGLAATPGIGAIAVQAVLGGGAVHAAQRVVAEVEQRQMRLAEGVSRVGIAHEALHARELAHGPAIQRLGRRVHGLGHDVSRGQVADVAQQEAQRVAQLAVRLAGGLQVLQVHADVVLERQSAHPPAAHLGAEVLQQVLHLQCIAQTLAHLAAIAIHHESVRDQALERRRAGCAQRRQQAQLEPAAVLVAAFQIQLGGNALTSRAQHAVPAAAGLEPHVEDVEQLLERRHLQPLGRLRILRRVVAREQRGG